MDSEMMQGGEMEKRSISRSRRLIIKFLKLVAQHFRTTREVSFYAQQLCITTTYLYKLTHRRWNLSPKELIDQQTICEIKMLLSNTDMSVKEIAATLHFEDTPYMCRYFRQRTGVSPMEYRNHTSCSWFFIGIINQSSYFPSFALIKCEWKQAEGSFCSKPYDRLNFWLLNGSKEQN